MSSEMNSTPIIFCPDCDRRVVNNPESLPEFDDENSHCNLCSCHQKMDDPASCPPPPSPPPSCISQPIGAPPSVSRTFDERRDAARTGRRRAKVFKREWNLDYPKCLVLMMYDAPRDIYKALNLDKDILDMKLEAHETAAQERASRKVAYSVSRDMLRYKNEPPRYFQFHNASTHVLCPEMTREEFWFMLSDDERKELIKENFEIEVQNIVSKVRTKTAIAHYQQCIRCIKGGLEAIRIRMRVLNMSKAEFISIYFESKKRKREAAACAEFEDIIFEDWSDGEPFNGEVGNE
jgi:hypothetical protein